MSKAAQLALFEDATPQVPKERALHVVAPQRVQTGDLWQLGRHRLLCGDSTDAAAVATLLQGQRIAVLLTDPPYGMRLDTDFSVLRSKLRFATENRAFGGRKYARVVGDHADFDASKVAPQWRTAPEQFWFGADYYASTLGDTMHGGAWLVWDKRNSEAFDRMFGSCFELIWSRKRHKRDILRHTWAGIFGTEKEPQRKREHPTQKPVRLIEDMIGRYSKPGAIIGDPYLGSGTTLIACERTERTCYAAEIEPHYCDVILRRWEQATGQQATLLERIDTAA